MQETKSMIRLKHAAAMTGGKKPKKAAKGEKPEEAKSIENVVIFVGENFPAYQKKVLEILSTFEFKDNQI